RRRRRNGRAICLPGATWTAQLPGLFVRTSLAVGGFRETRPSFLAASAFETGTWIRQSDVRIADEALGGLSGGGFAGPRRSIGRLPESEPSARAARSGADP